MTYPTTRTTKTARLFVPKGTRTQNNTERQTHDRAYLLKDRHCTAELMDDCAGEMAQLIAGQECILIPVPDHNGDTAQNLRLAECISRQLCATRSKVIDILTRSEQAESQCERHKKNERPLTPKALKITVKPHKMFKLLKVYFVDNVITSGATIQACHDALGFGTGLCYAEALRRA